MNIGISSEIGNLIKNGFIVSVKVRRFNRAKPQPDVLEEEKISAYPSSVAPETGFR